MPLSHDLLQCREYAKKMLIHMLQLHVSCTHATSKACTFQLLCGPFAIVQTSPLLASTILQASGAITIIG